MNKFQLILTGTFGAFIVIALIIFSTSRGNSSNQVNLVLWGTIPKQTFITLYSALPGVRDRNFAVEYVEKDPANFDNEFIDALASGIGPDLIMISHDSFLKHRNKLFPIPYSTLPERDYKDTFIEESELYALPEGIFGVPVAVDPLVMYWNRDSFTSKGEVQPPRFWDEFFNLSQKLTEKDASFNILHSAFALGEYRNVDNAKEILTTLILQAGSPIVTERNGDLVSVLNEKNSQPIIPAESAVSFYTEFSNPAKPFYTWNRSLTGSQNRFLSGDNSIYFGFSSELPLLRVKNPNLNFDVAIVPQTRGGTRSTTFGRMLGVSIIRASQNIVAAYEFVADVSSKNGAEVVSEMLRLPPARRDLLAEGTEDPYESVFYQSAILSKGWYDPDPDKTDVMFQELIESITSGRTNQGGALKTANSTLQALLK